MKKNILFIVIDSVTNDVLFNKTNSNSIAPFLNELRKKSISGDKMFSEAPFTEAALVSLLGSIDTLDNSGYMEKLKNTKSVLEVFKENNYKVFYNTYHPSIYPSYMVKGFDEYRYSEGFNFNELWGYRFLYFAPLYLENKLTDKEKTMLEDMLEDNFKAWIEFLEKLKNKDIETCILYECTDISNIETDIKKLYEEKLKFNKNKKKYLKELFTLKKEHPLFKIDLYKMNDKVHNDSVRNIVMNKYKDIFKEISNKNFKYNLRNNKFPFKKLVKSIAKGDFKTCKGLLASFKNSLVDKDLYDRIGSNYDLFKNKRSFYTFANELCNWIKNNKKNPWMSYIQIEDAHYNENFFTYDTDNIDIIDKDFEDIKEYLNTIPKEYKGSITYDLALRYCDKVIKNIFEFLKEEKILDNTSIVITADHGFSYYFSPIREKFVVSNYRENYNVPFIIYDRNIKPKNIDGFCQTKDIPSTLLGLANIDKPKTFKGENLLTFNGRESALLEYMGGGCPDIKRRPINIGIRTDNYFITMDLDLNKKIEEQKLKEIYDLKKDPYEHNNLVNCKNIDKKIIKEKNILIERYNELYKMYIK